MASVTLLTTGYAGHTPESFIEKLQEYDVETVVDVRQRPLSRKRGFSRTGLSIFLEENGIQYVHVRELGVPIELREQLKSGACDLPTYLDAFGEYVVRQEVALNELYAMALAKTCCLLCVEHRAEECHRSVVATAMANRNGRRVKIEHI
jgi:uncharacterized protein (DUF488 family)